MCGIVAIISRNQAVDPERLNRATSSIGHRGPDGERTWISADRRVGLGHSRLAIIDLVTGDQPIASENQLLHLVVNGEFYDFEAIRSRLLARGHRFRTGSDSEIALHLYEDRGPSALLELRGEFAFVLWDAEQRAVFAARDRVGAKPLFWAQTPEGLFLASEVKALFAAGVPARWSAEHVFDAAAYHSALNTTTGGGATTLFDGVYQVPPGHYLWAPEGGPVQVVPYWDYRYRLGSETLDFEEAKSEVLRQLDEAVRLRLRADVPVGCYLSAGIDSAAVLALATRHRGSPLTAFTMAFEDEAYDEGGEAERIATDLGAHYVSVDVDYDQMADVYLDSVRHAETYFWNSNPMSKYLLSRAVSKAGIKVVLSGQGSDEVFAGYSSFVRDAEVAPAAPMDDGSPLSRSLRRVFDRLGFVPTHLSATARSAAACRPLLSDVFAQRFAGRDGNWMLLSGLDLESRVPADSRLARSMYLWNRTALPDYLLSTVGDRQEMANAVESRIPFLDHPLIDIVGTMPAQFKIADGMEKHLLREAMVGIVPDWMRTRRKKPFLAPPASLDPGSRLSQALRAELLGDLPDFFDRARVQRFVDTMPSVEKGRFLVPTNEDDRRLLQADLVLTFLSSMSALGRLFGLTLA